MRYDGPPGLMLDLVPASPDGIDLEWIHPYTYANNNPLDATDPSGLAPKKPKTGNPEPVCKFELCCGAMVFPNGKPVLCINGPDTKVLDKRPCHCFIRVTKGDGKIEFHGSGEVRLGRDECLCSTVLVCGRGQPESFAMSGHVECVELKRKAKTCQGLVDCLERQLTKCENKTADCYGFCGSRNSNTIAHEFAQACAKKSSLPKNPSTKGTDCDSDPPTPGW
jgi:hypothetical protein